MPSTRARVRLSNKGIEHAARQAASSGVRVEIWDSEEPGLHVRVTPNGARSYAVRYRDAETGKKCRVTLGRALTVDEARKKARDTMGAVDKGEDPRGKRDAKATASLVQLVEGFYRDNAELRAGTVETYKLATSRLVAEFGKLRGVEVDRATLQAIRATVVKAPKQGYAKGRGRGARQASAAKRSPATINTELRTLRTVLNYLRRGGHLPKLDGDAIVDTLRSVPARRAAPEFLNTEAIGKLLASCERHDAAVYRETRAEHRINGPAPGSTARYHAMRPFVAFLLCTGVRLGEALRLRWADVQLDAVDDDGEPVGEIVIHASESKTHRGRTVDLAVTPMVRSMLAAMKLRAGAAERVWEEYTEGSVSAACRRLVGEFGAPSFSPQLLRATCATFLCNSPGIFGSSVATFREAKQLGHSVAVAEHHYAGALRGVSREAATVEAAMRIAKVDGAKRRRAKS